MNLLTELNENGTTVIMVTHSPIDAEYAHRIIHLFDGLIVAENVGSKVLSERWMDKRFSVGSSDILKSINMNRDWNDYHSEIIIKYVYLKYYQSDVWNV